MPKLDLQVPDFKAPDIKVPDFKAPDLKIPDFKAPDLDFKAPDIKVPDFSAPKFDMPKVDLPKVDAPKAPAPEFKAPDIKVPEFSAPKFAAPSFDLPKVDLPKVEAPKVALPPTPSFSTPKSEYISTDFEDDIDPQEVRDQRAAEAKSVYKDADKAAKVSFINCSGVEFSDLYLESLVYHCRSLKLRPVISETLLMQRRNLPRLLRTKLARPDWEERSFAFVRSTRDTREGITKQSYSLVVFTRCNKVNEYFFFTTG